MNKLSRALGLALGALALGLGLFLVGMRFHDGPIGIWSGGPFTSGSPAPAPASWDFLTDRSTIEFQTLDPATSRTVWLTVYKGRLFIVSGYMKTGFGKIWKQWPQLQNQKIFCWQLIIHLLPLHYKIRWILALILSCTPPPNI